MYELYVKKTFKLCKQDPGLRGCVLATSGILIVHLCIYNVFIYLLKFIVNYEDFEPNMFQQHHKIEYHCFVFSASEIYISHFILSSGIL